MDGTRVKTILICFLLLINALLGAFVALREIEDKRIETDAATNAVSALAALGIAVDISLVVDSGERLYTLEEERDAAQEIAAYGLLVEGTHFSEQGSGIYLIDGRLGRARISSAGIYDVEFTSAPKIFNIAEMFEVMKISPEVMGRTTGVQMVSGVPVFNRGYEMTFYKEVLKSVSGGFLLGEIYVSDGTPSKSAVAAMLALAEYLQATGRPCGEITAARQGYAAERLAAGYTTLRPYWYFDTDCGEWYVQAISLVPTERLP